MNERHQRQDRNLIVSWIAFRIKDVRKVFKSLNVEIE